MKLNNIDFNKIAIFCQIVDSGSYQRAAEVLNVTSSALSQNISFLEHHLGFALFDRVGRKLVPTSQGLHLHREFKEHRQNFLNGIQDLGMCKNEIGGTLKIGAYLEFAKSHLTPFLTKFIASYPEVQIKMTFDTPTRLQSLLEEGHLDLCFSIYPAKGKKTISSKSVYEEELVLISAKNRGLEPLSFEKMSQLPMIEYYTNHQPIRRWIKLHYQKQAKKIPVRIFASTAEMVLSLVKEGAGIGVVPLYLVETSEHQKNLRIIRPTAKKLTDYIWLLEKNTKAKTAAHKAFIQSLEKSFRI